MTSLTVSDRIELAKRYFPLVDHFVDAGHHLLAYEAVMNPIVTYSLALESEGADAFRTHLVDLILKVAHLCYSFNDNSKACDLLFSVISVRFDDSNPYTQLKAFLITHKPPRP